MVVPPEQALPIIASPLTVVLSWVQNLKRR